MDPELKPSETLQVGEKSYTVADVETMLAAQANATKISQPFSELQKAATRYGMTPEEFVQQAQGSFAAVASLIDKKIIDENGELVMQAQGQGEEDDLLSSLFGKETQAAQPQPAALPGNASGQLRVLAQALQEVRGTSGQLRQELESLKKDNAVLLEHNLKGQLKGLFPALGDEEMGVAIGRARVDRSKSLSEHAQQLVDAKQGTVRAVQLQLAKELGIEDLDGHLNQLKQQKTGGAGAIFEGKKISFKPKDANSVTPKQAAEAFLNAQMR